MHAEAHEYISTQVKEKGPFKRVLDLGGRDVNGSIRSLFPEAQYVCLDILPGPGVDVVADGADWISPEKFDLVVCCETLEHTPRAPEIISRSNSNLISGGLLMITTASCPRLAHSAFDGGPLRPGEYYSNIERPTLSHWFHEAGFITWKIETRLASHGGDIYGCAKAR